MKIVFSDISALLSPGHESASGRMPPDDGHQESFRRIRTPFEENAGTIYGLKKKCAFENKGNRTCSSEERRYTQKQVC